MCVLDGNWSVVPTRMHMFARVCVLAGLYRHVSMCVYVETCVRVCVCACALRVN